MILMTKSVKDGKIVTMQDREKYQVESKVHDFNDQICERQ